MEMEAFIKMRYCKDGFHPDEREFCLPSIQVVLYLGLILYEIEQSRTIF